jgi:hypothetical protein
MVEEEQNQPESLPVASFSTLVLSLAMSALEVMAGPDRPGETPRDHRLARPMIDSLEILKEKTKGNLTEEETALLDSLLFDLRLQYLRADTHPPAGKPEPPAKPNESTDKKPD